MAKAVRAKGETGPFGLFFGVGGAVTIHQCCVRDQCLPKVCEVSLYVQVQDGGWSGGAQRRAVLAQ